MLSLSRLSLRCGALSFRALDTKIPLKSSLAVHSQILQTRLIHTTPTIRNEENKKPPNWSVIMSEDQKKRKKEHIHTQNEEAVPSGLIPKVKYYLKRYWYIAIPAHMICSTMYLAGFYFAVYSGIDVVSLLQTLHLPELIIEKVKNTPPQAGALVVALILYKVATPLRYLTTLGFIQAAFVVLRRMGKLRTVREVEYKARVEYEKGVGKYGRRAYKNRHLGVREIAKENEQQATKLMKEKK
ncbi:unnamed protein product, partial [Mesorhabditis belari]|uniref:DUF1279 domain-containing protein n=1 Tax=Mesorhabditis belari TaxID=2138241 RepID=A0AAF3FCE3_9BILA